MIKPIPVHILGAGSIGIFIASKLSNLKTSPSITLLLRNLSKVENFQSVYNSTIQLKSKITPQVDIQKFKFNSSCPESFISSPSIIENLIITTKTYQTEEALQKYLPFIKPSSNIILVQNGLGVPQKLYENIWPNLQERPNLFQGVIGHGINTQGGWIFTHTGLGDLKISKIPKDLNNPDKESVQKPEIVELLENCKELDTICFEYSDLLLFQIKKFVANASINSITSIIDCINYELRSYEGLQGLVYDTISEIIDILVTTTPIIKKNPQWKTILDKQELTKFVLYYATEVHANSSTSMRQDVLNNRITEIDYLNGYIVKLAEENGLKADVNKTITNLVKLRSSVNRSRAKLI
ncbi:Glycerol-3-phosphate dehydrogenase [NAD(P)+] [Wickerhamomyces ciferrii]|uniref:2-dehydropantoate 2-reductase n=1 Tax=Wickerhamomyces ciferrii (strain ATCC 14091 / BCRC 22168 / CBS 111 / JCM 3599 / NBRC 0793 / NRRL Y-1031 F-60-10) TaxID=1206466 RepID=K0KKY6_WICCF|nr:Glycerol-3-phosphate dehydrogenase [NAD(P)+] [Wickerhamomyces ciferrii]CCH45885.1 Glycerol-3-phosphate dehydrogenase [NAD(P)+] [Wickerhamomyces ciferrii]